MLQELANHWYFHLPNYALAALGYTLVARFILGFFVKPEWDNYIWRFFVRVTEPALTLARAITPLHLAAFLPLIAAFWTFVLRYLLYSAMAGAGLLATTS